MPEPLQSQSPGDDGMEQWQLIYQQVLVAAHRIAQAAGVRVGESSCDFTPNPGRLHIDLVLDFGDRFTS